MAKFATRRMTPRIICSPPVVFSEWSLIKECCNLQACACDSIGSISSQCDVTTGICTCKPGVQGDKCTECQDGYKLFSSSGCSECSCNEAGSLSNMCNKSNGQCPCKVKWHSFITRGYHKSRMVYHETN